MIQSLTAASGLVLALLIQTAGPVTPDPVTPDPVTSETRPRQLIALEGPDAEHVIARARAELTDRAQICDGEPCNYVFPSADEIMGSMCWNDAAAGETYCKGAVAGTRVEFCHVDQDGSLYDCGYWEMMEGAVSEALADDPRLAGRDIHWMSMDRAGDIFFDIAQSAYCANPPEGACTRFHNPGEIRYEICSEDGQCAGGREGWIFEHCWDDAASGLAQCRQAIITPGEAAD